MKSSLAYTQKFSQTHMTHFSLSRHFLTYFLVTAVVVTSFGQPRSLVDDIEAIMEQHEVVGMSVAVVNRDEIIYSKAFGLKDLESKTPLRENDIFRIASISKSFSATAIMQLAEEKKLSLDDDFGNLIGFKIRHPKYPDRVITLKMVLSHTSSINDSQGYFSLDVINPARNANWASCYSDYAPGEAYQYCNLNFNMTGAVIERFSGERFDEYVRNHILRPLKLYGGYCVDSLDSRLFTTLYEYDSASRFEASPMAYAPRRQEIATYVMGYSTPIFSPTGGMKISAHDLARYMIMHMQFGESDGVRIISKKSAKRMQKAISGEDGYGLGMMNKENLIPGKTMTGHTGLAYGLYSAMFFQPKEKFGFVVIVNGCKPSFTNGVNTVLTRTINCLYDNFVKRPSGGPKRKDRDYPDCNDCK